MPVVVAAATDQEEIRGNNLPSTEPAAWCDRKTVAACCAEANATYSRCLKHLNILDLRDNEGGYACVRDPATKGS